MSIKDVEVNDSTTAVEYLANFLQWRLAACPVLNLLPSQLWGFAVEQGASKVGLWFSTRSGQVVVLHCDCRGRV